MLIGVVVLGLTRNKQEQKKVRYDVVDVVTVIIISTIDVKPWLESTAWVNLFSSEVFTPLSCISFWLLGLSCAMLMVDSTHIWNSRGQSHCQQSLPQQQQQWYGHYLIFLFTLPNFDYIFWCLLCYCHLTCCDKYTYNALERNTNRSKLLHQLQLKNVSRQLIIQFNNGISCRHLVKIINNTKHKKCEDRVGN